MPHFPVQVRSLVKAVLFCFVYLEIPQMPRIMYDRDRKTLKYQIHSMVSVQVLLSVVSSLLGAVVPAFVGWLW